MDEFSADGTRNIKLGKRIEWENVRRMFFTSVCFLLLFFGLAVFAQMHMGDKVNKWWIWSAFAAAEGYALLSACVSCQWLMTSKKKRKNGSIMRYLFWGFFLLFAMYLTFCAGNGFWTIITYTISAVMLSMIPLWNQIEFSVLSAVQSGFAIAVVLTGRIDGEQIVYLVINLLLCAVISRQGYYNYQKREMDASKIDNVRMLSETDPMTGLMNRRGMEHILKSIWPACMCAGRNTAVLMIDIDNFKKYNDCFGHQEGDRCIQKVAGQIQKIVSQKMDFAARVGGEEFVIFLTDVDKKEAVSKAVELKESVEGMQIPQAKDNFLPFVSISIGMVCERVKPNSQFERIQKRADESLYQAKNQGRACICMEGKCITQTSTGRNQSWYQVQKQFRSLG